MIPPAELTFPILSAIVPLGVLDTSVDRVSISPGLASLPPSFFVQFGNETEANVIARDFTMTSEQWNEWGEGVDDSDYILTCASAVLGFTVAV